MTAVSLAFVEIDNKDALVRAGGVLCGKLILQCTGNDGSDLVSHQHLELRFHGRETTTRGNTTSRVGKDNEILRSYNLVSTSSRFSYGQSEQGGFYEFPFSYSLPSDLPASLTIRNEKADERRIEYTLEATTTTSTTGPCLLVQRVVRVLAQSLPTKVAPKRIPAQTFRIKGGNTWLKSTRRVKLGLRISNTEVAPGQAEAIKIQPFGRRQSGLIKTVRVALLETISFCNPGSTTTTTTTSLCKTLVEVEESAQQAIQPLSLVEDFIGVILPIPRQVHCSSLPSSRSVGLQVHHEVVVSFDTGCGDGGKDPVFSFPITIAFRKQDNDRDSSLFHSSVTTTSSLSSSELPMACAEPLIDETCHNSGILISARTTGSGLPVAFVEPVVDSGSTLPVASVEPVVDFPEPVPAPPVLRRQMVL